MAHAIKTKQPISSHPSFLYCHALPSPLFHACFPFLSIPLLHLSSPSSPFIPASSFMGPSSLAFLHPFSVRSNCKLQAVLFIISLSSPSSSSHFDPSRSDGSKALLLSSSYCILRLRFLDSAGLTVTEITSLMEQSFPPELQHAAVHRTHSSILCSRTLQEGMRKFQEAT